MSATLKVKIDTASPTADIEVQNFINAVAKAMKAAGATHYIPRARRRGTVVEMIVVLAHDGSDPKAKRANDAAGMMVKPAKAPAKTGEKSPTAGLAAPKSKAKKKNR